MILRKPYAFFIKKFKLIHLIMAILIGYLIYRSTLILNFLNDYITNMPIITGTELTEGLFNILMFFLPFLIIVSSVIIVSVMFTKKKPYMLYISNIIFYVILIILYTYLNDTIGSMELKILDIRVVRAARDILMIGVLAQCISLVFMFIRATGFDLKKFDFGKDLKELEIKKEDNEEFEVNIDVDTNKFRRGYNRFKRKLKYFYVEHKFIFAMIVTVTIMTILFTTYMNLNIFKKDYQIGTTFRTTDFTITINDCYRTNKNYVLNDITDKELIVLKITLKRNAAKEKKLDIARTELLLNGKAYYHTDKYRDNLLDLGNSYENQLINQNEVTYLLVYEIPNITAKMKFSYVDQLNLVSGKLEPATINVDLASRNLDKLKDTKEYNLNETINLKDTILKDSDIMLSDSSVQKTFTLKYSLCLNTQECYGSVEYLNAKLNSNYDKSLLKLSGELNLQNKISGINNLFDFVKMFGKLKYKIGGIEKTIAVTSRVIPTKVNSKDFYIEVPSELENADTINLELNIRDYKYVYKLK